MNAELFRNVCTHLFRKNIECGRAMFPGATHSHLCIRSKDDEDFQSKILLAHELGAVTLKPKADGKQVAFVELHQPLTQENQGIFYLTWLEITAPSDKFPMLVFAQQNAETIEKISPDNETFILRLQAKSAAEILQAQ